MKKYFSLLLLVLSVSIESSEAPRGRSNTWTGFIKRVSTGGVTKQKCQTPVKEKAPHGREVSPNSRYAVINEKVMVLEAQRPEIEAVITSLEICPKVKGIGIVGVSAYWHMLQIVGDTFLQTPQADKKENRAIVVEVKAALQKVDEYRRWSAHLAIAHGNLHKRSSVHPFNKALENDLGEFQKIMDARLQRARLEEERVQRLRARPSTQV